MSKERVFKTFKQHPELIEYPNMYLEDDNLMLDVAENLDIFGVFFGNSSTMFTLRPSKMQSSA